MSRFIEEFYYGNIDPQARSTKENKAVQKQMEILMNNEDLLTNALTDNPKVNGKPSVYRLKLQKTLKSI